ncbi:uncharacterized protein LOC110841003 [Zootermopsis nevadensis]|uniref:uncharacterized protein LOC110841003 n=1 Tax=Zootermopsis nevadensis TaxID=136037 RepID=UPI000B8E965F|nr:uncharacterized protein LOC110841003 [Zootermopsis nevadensis]
MYLIILFGVVGKLALVSGQCDLGTPKLENVDWNELTGKWYWLYHTSNKVEDNLDCVRTIYAFSLNGISVFNTVYNKRKQRKVTFAREASNFRTNGYFNILTAKCKYELKCPVTFYSGNNTKRFHEESKLCHIRLGPHDRTKYVSFNAHRDVSHKIMICKYRQCYFFLSKSFQAATVIGGRLVSSPTSGATDVLCSVLWTQPKFPLKPV